MVTEKLLRKLRMPRTPLGFQAGYLLPAVLIIGLGISTVSIMALQTIAHNSSSLTTQYHGSLAKEAAQAGIAAAIACINNNNGTRVWGTGGTSTQETLTPKGCSATPTGTNDFIDDNNEYRSTYRALPVYDLNDVGSRRTTSIITAKGIVQIKGPGGTIVSTIEHTARTQVDTVMNSASDPGKKNVIQVSVGSKTACGITSDASINDYWVYCWGDNSNLQLGAGRHMLNSRSTVPVAVYSSTTGQAALPRGPCTGLNIGGNCIGGVWNPEATPAQPATPMAGKRAVKVSVGNTHTCAIAQDGTDDASRRAYCWGRNDYGQLGNASTSRTDSLIPVEVYTGTSIARSCTARDWFGNCYQWNMPRDIATSSLRDSSGNPKTVVDISAGNGFTCALTSDGLVSCWGRNSDGQLGDGTRDDTRAPVAVSRAGGSALASPTTISKLAIVKGNATTMCAVTTTDDGVCWGKSDVGQTGNGVPIDSASRNSGQITRNSGNPNQCSTLRTQALSAARSAAGGSPHADSDNLLPVSVVGGHKFNTIIINDAEQSGDSYEDLVAGTGTNRQSFQGSSTAYVTAQTTNGRAYYWGGTRSFDSYVDCQRNSDTYGGDWSRATARVSRDYTGVSTPTLRYNDTPGNLHQATLDIIAGNSFNNLFCATTNGSLYCDNNGSTVRQGQMGDGRVIHCSTNIFGQTTCSPTPASGPTLVSTTQQADTSSIHGSHLTLGMVGSISSLDIGTSGYGCALVNITATISTVLCWGVNGDGQLGVNSTSNRFAPTFVYTDDSTGLGKANPGGGGVPGASGTATFNSSNGTIPSPTAGRSF